MRFAVLADDVQGATKLLGTGSGDRVVESHGQVGGGGVVEAFLTHRPGFEVVGQRQQVEVVALRRAGTGDGGQPGK